MGHYASDIHSLRLCVRGMPTVPARLCEEQEEDEFDFDEEVDEEGEEYVAAAQGPSGQDDGQDNHAEGLDAGFGEVVEAFG